ncbi:hypothetical protein HYT23_06000, partial [Candidatus Pacearchaeota archaeon]|nr:hypothetical protein [Candidatus Pacearchaeota archaeon]
METRIIASAILKDKNKYLIAKRASSKKYAPGKWEFISGFIETKESAENIIASIQNAKHVTLPRFLYSLGILHIGEESARDLANFFASKK